MLASETRNHGRLLGVTALGVIGTGQILQQECAVKSGLDMLDTGMITKAGPWCVSNLTVAAKGPWGVNGDVSEWRCEHFKKWVHLGNHKTASLALWFLFATVTSI